MHEVRAQKCVECGEVNDRSSTINGPDDIPRPGNIAVCLHCGHVAAVADDLTLRPLTDKEMCEIAGDPALLAAQELRVRLLEKWKKAAPKN